MSHTLYQICHSFCFDAMELAVRCALVAGPLSAVAIAVLACFIQSTLVHLWLATAALSLVTAAIGWGWYFVTSTKAAVIASKLETWTEERVDAHRKEMLAAVQPAVNEQVQLWERQMQLKMDQAVASCSQIVANHCQEAKDHAQLRFDLVVGKIDVSIETSSRLIKEALKESIAHSNELHEKAIQHSNALHRASEQRFEQGLRHMDSRMAKIDSRLNKIDTRTEALEKFAQRTETQLAGLQTTVNAIQTRASRTADLVKLSSVFFSVGIKPATPGMSRATSGFSLGGPPTPADQPSPTAPRSEPTSSAASPCRRTPPRRRFSILPQARRA